MEESLRKELPNNIEAEQSVLGAMLLDKEAIISAIEVLKADDFYRESHSEIYDTLIYLFNENQPIDLVTVCDELKRRNKLDAVGGIAYITNLSSAVPITKNVKYYATIVEENATVRNLIKSAGEIVELGYNPNIKVSELLEKAQKNIYDIAHSRIKRGFTPIKEVLDNTFDKIEDLFSSDKKITGKTSGFVDIDTKLKGFNNSDLILVAARPAMGKSAFALNLAQSAAIKEDSTVAIFSLEMSKEQLMMRILASESMVDIGKIQTGDLEDDDWVKITEAITPLSNANIYFDDSPGITVTEMRSKCRRLKLEGKLDMVLIDYLQLMESSGRTENRQQEISAISRSLKIMAKELDCPIIALSQLSRAPEQRSDHRPMLSDLRESGAIEQDADLVIFLYRDEYYHEDSEMKNIAEIIIAKNRHGETGTIELYWSGSHQRFLDLDKNREN